MKPDKDRSIEKAAYQPEEQCTLPWQRYDTYGECGLDPQPLSENIRLIMFAILLVPIKLCGAIAALLSFFVVTKLAWILPKSVRSDWVATLGKIHCRICLFFIGFVRVRWVDLGKEGRGQATSVTPVGIVSNHCSWCDILVHMSHFFPAFVSRKSTSTSPIVGSISKSMGCLFVERAKTVTNSDETNGTNGNNGNNGNVSNQVKERMMRFARGNPQKERPILLFPEATTTNGCFLLPFRSGAFLAGEPLQPVVLKYETRKVSPCWESIVANRHAFLMLCNPFHSVTCYKLPVYVPSPEEKADPRLYASNMRDFMLKASGLRPSDLTYIDKVEYVDALRRKHGYKPRKK